MSERSSQRSSGLKMESRVVLAVAAPVRDQPDGRRDRRARVQRVIAAEAPGENEAIVDQPRGQEEVADRAGQLLAGNAEGAGDRADLDLRVKGLHLHAP